MGKHIFYFKIAVLPAVTNYFRMDFMLKDYQNQTQERAKSTLPPLPLSAEQTAELILLIKNPGAADVNELLDMLINRVPAGVDQAAFVKAAFLNDIALEKTSSSYISSTKAIELLGTMLGGYNVQALVDLLKTDKAEAAVKALSKITLIFDAFYDVEELHLAGNKYATQLIQSWADAEWFISKKGSPKSIEAIVFRAEGEINTDDLSPAQEAWSRADIPLHAKSMLQNKMPEAIDIISKLKDQDLPLVFVGDIVGTGSSRKSAINSLQWHMGIPIPFIPNKHTSGIVLANKIAPISFNTAEDSGALPIECDVATLEMGDKIKIDLENQCILKMNPKCVVLI